MGAGDLARKTALAETQRLLSEELEAAQASFREAAAHLAATSARSADSHDLLEARRARKQAYNLLIHATKRWEDFTKTSITPDNLMSEIKETQ